MTIILDNIPRIYTALAEWMAATIYIAVMRPKFSLKKIIPISAGWLLFQILFLCLTQKAPIVFWIPVMMLALVSMYAYIKTCTNIPNIDIGFCCARIFVLAEFAASLGWQIYSYLEDIGMTNHWLNQIIIMLLIYTIIFVGDFIIEIRKLPKDKGLGVTTSELVSTIAIAVTVFLFSNLSFVDINTPFSGKNHQEIFYIRTLVDFCGLLFLFSQQDERQKRRLSYEKEVMDDMLARQYNQYKMSRDNIAVLNMKYHDLKHQIIAIRQEHNQEKREQYLQEMEDRIKLYESEFQTGSHVLDILLTSKSEYCRINSIDFTCMADGTILQFMDKMDICSIFGNALDNAIENVMKMKNIEKRLIRIALFAKDQFVMIRFENYSENSYEFTEGLPTTTKKDKGSHGYGLKSIHQITQKYGGTMTIKTEDNWFVLRILIPVSKSSTKVQDNSTN